MRQKLVDFSKYSAIKVGSQQVVEVIEEISPIKQHIIGKANNMIVGEGAPSLALLGKAFDYIVYEDETLRIGAATPSGKIVSFCKQHNLGGLEFLAHLPGSLGGLVAMNAGLKAFEIFNALIDVTTVSGVIQKEQITHGYRFSRLPSPIFEARLRTSIGFSAEEVSHFAQMRANQPKASSAGSFFKNPTGDYAGRLIESVGLKGYQKGQMAWSECHANFLVNNGNGSIDDALWLINEAKRRVYETHGVMLEDEVQVLDARYSASSYH